MQPNGLTGLVYARHCHERRYLLLNIHRFTMAVALIMSAVSVNGSESSPLAGIDLQETKEPISSLQLRRLPPTPVICHSCRLLASPAVRPPLLLATPTSCS